MARQKTQVDLRYAQKVFDEIDKPKKVKLYQNLRCPKNCTGRVTNKGNCNQDNCIKLHRNKTATRTIKVIHSKEKLEQLKIDVKNGVGDKRKLRGKLTKKLNSREKRLISNIDVNAEYRYYGRNVVKKQLKSLGIKMPRLTDVDRKKLRRINNLRKKLGRRPLACLPRFKKVIDKLAES
jgi:hypothetical protein